MAEAKDNRIESCAARLMRLASDTIIVNMRFMDVALGRLPVKKRDGLMGVAADGVSFYYDPLYILKKYAEDENYVTRLYLHSILHCVFNHSFGYKEMDEELWDLSCDIAVENMIMELEVADFSLSEDDERRIRLKGLKKYAGRLTAEGIYRYYLANPLAASSRAEMTRLFARDSHVYWREAESYELSENEWKKISERIKADIKSFSKNPGHSESLIKNLEDATKEKYDYKRLLERFCERGEELTVSDEEFDYIYYTYGLTRYDNMPLIEPLEFKDEKRIREFAIVLDTSASCRGDVIRSFLTRTYDILMNSESFSSKVNVHLIQCDSEVQQDVRIKDRGEFEAFIRTGRLIGYGGTDFRPAFEYIDSLIENGEFKNFKGLIYFTDGYGIYPEEPPGYDCIFAFISEDGSRPDTPWWGIPVVLDALEVKFEH